MITIRSRWVLVPVVLAFVAAGFVPAGATTGSEVRMQTEPPAAEFVEGPCAPVLEVPASRCGELVVPENRSKSNGKTIRLAVAIIPAVSGTPAPAPLLWIDGGPGGDPMSTAPELVASGLNQDRDLMLMGLRGTYSATPHLVCPEIDDYRANSLARKFTAPSTSDAAVKAAARCARRLRSEGIDIAAYNTTENARDVAELRTALGIDEWDVLSHSYGTDVALTYMRRYPEGIRSMVLDGTVPPSKGSLGWTWTSFREFFDNVLAACDADPACRERYPDTEENFTRLVNQLETDPITTEVTLPHVDEPLTVKIDGGVLVNWLTRESHFAANIPMAIDQLANGSPDYIAKQWADARNIPPDARGRFAHGDSYGVWCAEWVPYETKAEELRTAKREFPDFPRSVLAQAPQLSYLRELCEKWDVPKAPKSIRDVTESPIPTLAITGTYDAQTGAQWGAYAAETLPNSTVVEIPGVSHAAWVNPCAAEIINSFGQNPSSPDTSCAASVQVPEFVIEPSAGTTGTTAASYEPGECPEVPAPIEEQLQDKDARCGVLVVPENRAKGGDRTIRLAVATVPAKSADPAPDPLVFMVGGPGGIAWTQIRGAIEKVGMNDQRDVIFMEQRGTQFNDPELECPEVQRVNKRVLALPFFDPSARRQFVRATRACRERLTDEGVDLSAYNTTENAADFADLRTALGINEWNVYGGSYGSDLALTYERNHPEGVRSVTVDSITPPDVASLSWTWTSVGEGVSNLFAACADEPRCAQRYPRLAQTFDKLVNDLEAKPKTVRVETEDGEETKVLVDGGTVMNWISEATTFSTADVPAIIDAAANGDVSTIAEARAASAGEGQALGMSNSILCSEWVAYEPFSAILEEGRRSFPELPDSVLAQAPGLRFLADGGCRAWDVPNAPASVRDPARSSIPTLVLGGSFDALTGEQWAGYVAGQLENATLIKVPAAGHGALFNPCPQQVFASFLANPSAPDTSCIPQMAPASAYEFTIES